MNRLLLGTVIVAVLLLGLATLFGNGNPMRALPHAPMPSASADGPVDDGGIHLKDFEQTQVGQHHAAGSLPAATLVSVWSEPHQVSLLMSLDEPMDMPVFYNSYNKRLQPRWFAQQASLFCKYPGMERTTVSYLFYEPGYDPTRKDPRYDADMSVGILEVGPLHCRG